MALSFIMGGYLPAPALCLCCGSTGKDSIDTGKTEDYYGRVLICVDCYRGAATSIPELHLMTQEAYELAFSTYKDRIEKAEQTEHDFEQLVANIKHTADSARSGFTHHRVNAGIFGPSDGTKDDDATEGVGVESYTLFSRK